MERITSAQPPPYVPKHASVDIADMHGLDFPIYVCKPRRGMKSGHECKETYKLPHRLIEKKRRDRINECIAQLKDLLPEHLKLTTLGHLEKAVVLELTLKHVKTLSALLEQQQQKILALQKDLQIGDNGGDGAEAGEEMFRSGFHLCAKEVLHYLASQESSRDLTPSHVLGHIQKVAAEVLQQRGDPRPDAASPRAPDRASKPARQPARTPEAPAKNCVPVIQRTDQQGPGEQSGSDTDTDSGYGGEHEKPKTQWSLSHRREGELKKPAPGAIKQEANEPPAKRQRSDSPEDELLCVHPAGAPGSYVNFSSPGQTPFCLPFYVLPPNAAAAAAAYLPMLEKCWYPGGMPVMYPQGSSLMSPRAGSPVPRQDSPALHKASKHTPPLNLEAKD
ncbi:class E basic helix-loop-helix protein 40 [Menidia menidia]